MFIRKEYIYKIANGVPIKADVYFKKTLSRQKSPIALHFHGGNFTVGSKDMLSQHQVTDLVDKGFVVASPNYRLCPTITVHDGPVTDALDAYDWCQTKLPDLLQNDAGITVDGFRIVTFGQSCGAALALSTAALPNPPLAILDLYGMKYFNDQSFHTALPPPPTDSPTFENSFLSQIWKDVPPPSSAPPPMGPAGPDFSNPRVAWMFDVLGKGLLMKEVVRDGNYERVDPARLFSKGRFPPTYFIHGAKDFLVPAELSQRAHDELENAGAETELVIIEGGQHGFDESAEPGSYVFDVVSKGFEFLRTHAEI
ncbi:hypothetical protein N7460_011685 [Penicillium canescens]|uniref:Alpha/beta hydrolase fold-3 domain-containing protein n=2 Tax=Penicillium canescens TaxID=5083 RepID=A0AAD6I1Y2_PENCN|nr:hypothetical protein N7460_011685 [Penicillium canescens]